MHRAAPGVDSRRDARARTTPTTPTATPPPRSSRPRWSRTTCCLSSYGPSDRRRRPRGRPRARGRRRAAGRRGLAAGRVVVFTPAHRRGRRGDPPVRDLARRRPTSPSRRRPDDVPAQLVAWDDAAWGPAPALSVLPTALADDLGVEVVDVEPAAHRRPRPATETRIRSRSTARSTARHALRRARLPAPARGADRPARARRARWRADARRHAHRDLPRALRRPPRPRHAVRRRRGAADPATGRGGVRPRHRLRRRGPRARRSGSSPASRSRGR